LRVSATLLTLFVCFVSVRAAAFPTGDRFDADSVSTAGGGGIYFTGSPAFPQAICSDCHTNPPRTAALRLGASPAELFTDGYIGGQVYQLEVLLENESKGLDHDGPARCGQVKGMGFVPCNSNGFAVEPTDDFGNTAGALCPESPDASGNCPSAVGGATLLSMNARALMSRGYLPAAGGLPAGNENDGTRWRFFWTAPPAGSGAVTFHVGMVDGNGGLGTVEWPQDTDGDDVVEAHVEVLEGGTSGYQATSGCALAARERPPFAPALLLLSLICILRRRAY